MHKNNNSFLQRQQNQHPAARVNVNPVRSNGGGYLRSPFEVQTDILGNARVGSAPSQRAVALSADATESVAASSSTERPWVRAGVGASRLSTKERNEQLLEAKQIYGDTSGPSSSAAPSFVANGKQQTVPAEANLTTEGDALSSEQAAPSTNASKAQQPQQHSAQHEEKRYVHKSVVEAKMLPKLLPSGGASLKKRPRELNDDQVVTGGVSSDDVSKSTTTAATEMRAQTDEPTSEGPTSNNLVSASNSGGGAATGPVVLSKRQEMERKRLEALYGSGKKKR